MRSLAKTLIALAVLAPVALGGITPAQAQPVGGAAVLLPPPPPPGQGGPRPGLAETETKTPAACVPQPASGDLHAAKSTYLGAAHYQNSDVWYHRDQNTITAATTTISNNWFGGFHATPIVVVSDSCGEVLGKAYPGSPFWASGKFEGNGSRTDNWGSASAGFKYAFSSDIQKMAARIDVQSVWTPKPRWGAILDCVAKAVLADPATTVTVVGFLGQVGKCI